MTALFQGQEENQTRAHKASDNVPCANAAPSLYEMEYLKQVAKELEVFLRSRSISTVKEIHLGFLGEGYCGRVTLNRTY